MLAQNRQPEPSIRQWLRQQGSSWSEMRRLSRLLAKRRTAARALAEIDNAIAAMGRAFEKRQRETSDKVRSS